MSTRREWTLDELVDGVRGGDRRALARAITLIENGDAALVPPGRRALPAHRARARGRNDGAAGRRQVDPDLGPRPAGPRRGAGGRRGLGRPVEPVHAGRAARRPDPADRPLPRPRGLHPLDGHARPPRRPGRDDAAGAARARRRRQGRRLPRDRRDRAERGGRAVDRRHRRARADAGLGRLDPGAEGRDHGDPGRDRDQQVGSSAREDDAERGAPGARTRAARGAAAGDRAHRGAARGRDRRALAGDPRPPRAARGRRGARARGAARTWRARSSRWRACAPGGISRTQSATTRSCSRLLAAVERRELDPLTAVREILEHVFRIRT